MDTYISSYTHNGVSYTHDSYTGQTIPTSVYRAIEAASSAASSAYIQACKAEKAAKEMERLATDPVYRAKVIAKAKKAKATVAKREAKVKADAATREELMAKARALADKMKAAGTIVTGEDIDNWRIANGYLWKAVSPKGCVYTEVIKAITIDSPEDYIVYNAMLIERTWNVI